jgi:hypothetical protein
MRVANGSFAAALLGVQSTTAYVALQREQRPRASLSQEISMAAVSELDRYIGSVGAAPRRAGVFARFIEAVKRSRMRAAEEEIARLIEMRGGRLTDSIERQIERTFI